MGPLNLIEFIPVNITQLIKAVEFYVFTFSVNTRFQNHFDVNFKMIKQVFFLMYCQNK